MSLRSQEEEDPSCPICFRSKDDQSVGDGLSRQEEVPFVYSPSCGHVFCLPCIERLLLAPQEMSRTSNDSQTTVTTTTLGVCPLCRTELSYFDLLVEGTQAPVVADDDPLDPRLLGAIFVENRTRGEAGWKSYHFPGYGLPYFSLDRITSPVARGYNSSGDSTARCLQFAQSRYHAATHTWEGRAVIDQGDDRRSLPTIWRVLLTFSDNFQYVARGVIIQKRMNKTPSSTEDESLRQTAQHCFDGTWLVRPCSNNANDESIHTTSASNNNLVRWQSLPERTIHLCQSSFVDHQVWYRLNPRNDDIEMCEAAELDTMIFTATWDWTQHPQGPNVIGSRLEWKTTQPQQPPFMAWIRLTQVPTLAGNTPDEVIPLGGNSGRIYRRVNDSDDRNISAAIPTYHSNTLWGNIFCQGYKVGLASYHFVPPPNLDSDGFVYISYEHADVAKWPSLDNGLPIPTRVMFRNISFPNAYTFRGHICWLQDYGTSWQGMVRWEYEMNFDTEFTCIVSGVVKSILADDDDEVLHEMSRYGDSLIYCNAALFDYYRRHGSAIDEELLIQRLMQEGTSLRTRTMVRILWATAQQSDETNPIEFG